MMSICSTPFLHPWWQQLPRSFFCWKKRRRLASNGENLRTGYGCSLRSSRLSTAAHRDLRGKFGRGFVSGRAPLPAGPSWSTASLSLCQEGCKLKPLSEAYNLQAGREKLLVCLRELVGLQQYRLEFEMLIFSVAKFTRWTPPVQMPVRKFLTLTLVYEYPSS